MSVKVYRGEIAIASTVTTGDLTAITGMTTAPVAMITSCAPDQNIGNRNAFMSVGMATAAAMRAVTGQSVHGTVLGAGTPSATARFFSNTACAQRLDATGASGGQFTISSWNSDGFTPHVAEQFGENVVVRYLAICGVTNAKIIDFSIGAGSVTGAGFTPSLAFLIGCGNAITAGTGGRHNGISVGFATAAEQASVSYSDRDAMTTTTTADSYCQSGVVSGSPSGTCFSTVTPQGTLACRAQSTGFTSDGMSLTWPTSVTTGTVSVLFLDTLKAHIYKVSSSTSLNTLINVPSTGTNGYTPVGGVVYSIFNNEPAATSTKSNAGVGFGLFTGTTDRAAVEFQSTNGVATTKVTSGRTSTAAYLAPNGGNTASSGQIDVNSVADPLVLKETAADNIASAVYVVTLGDSFAAGTASGSYSGGTVSLSATDASGGVATYSYQWKVSTDGGATWGNLSGAGTTGTTTLNATDASAEVTPGATLKYRLDYTDSATPSPNTASSNVVTITVPSSGPDAQPSAVTATLGTAGNAAITATKASSNGTSARFYYALNNAGSPSTTHVQLSDVLWSSGSATLNATGLPQGADVFFGASDVNAGGETAIQWTAGHFVVHSAPTATISTPNGGLVTPGLKVTLEGTANDPDTGALTGTALAWTSDKDGALGTGVKVSDVALSTNVHTITLTATDPEADTGTATITITVGTPATSGGRTSHQL